MTMTTPLDEWTADSWRSKPVAQDTEYPDPAALEAVCATLRSLPPLVSPARIEQLRLELAQAAAGRAFVMQGGDCAESFDDVRAEPIAAKRGLLGRQAAALAAALGQPVVQIARIAGQYAKPRSKPMEQLADGSVVHAFKGDNVNGRGATAAERTPDPHRLLLGHHLAATTLTFLRILDPTPVYTSHEALHLPLESALTHGRYNTSAAFVWVGERTRQLDGAHVEYVRGLRNPVGIKLGPTTDPHDLARLLALVNPTRAPGRVVLITRLGADHAEQHLPKLVAAVRQAGQLPVWMCDPCHANTFVDSQTGVKTRLVEHVAAEAVRTADVLRACGAHLAGLHLEQTGEPDVTECVDREHALVNNPNTAPLFPRYRSLCDPRLAPDQAMRVVHAVAHVLRSHHHQPDDDLHLPLPGTAHSPPRHLTDSLMPAPQQVQ